MGQHSKVIQVTDTFQWAENLMSLDLQNNQCKTLKEIRYKQQFLVIVCINHKQFKSTLLEYNAF